MIFLPTDLEVLKENKFYIVNKHVKKAVNSNVYLSIVTTNKCNRNCAYCINSKSDVKKDLPIDKALINAEKAYTLLGTKECVILGGEPTLYKDLINLIKGLKHIGYNKIVMTSNGVLLTPTTIQNIINAGLTHLNISMHNDNKEMATIGLNQMQLIYNCVKDVNNNIPVRINTNVWKNNNDTLNKLIDWLNKLQCMSDTIRVSNIIKKDNFSVNSINEEKTFEIMHSDNYYNTLFNDLINYYSKNYTIINNPNTLGFVDYTLIPTKSAIIINRNINSKVSEQICENEYTKINTVKLLVSGNLSLSWNENNTITL